MQVNNFLPVFVVLIFGLLGSCNSPEPETYKPLLDQEEMITLLSDIHLAEGTFQQYKGEERDSISALRYAQILHNHGLSRAEFEQEFEWWLGHPDRADELYIKILEYIDNRKGNE
ncbi:MAG: DUF4296 domain-containing protein [Bacteroidota bacterium]